MDKISLINEIPEDIEGLLQKLKTLGDPNDIEEPRTWIKNGSFR